MPITKVSNKMELDMFTSVSSRSASAYKRVGVETGVSTATPHQLVNLLFEALLNAVGSARAAMKRGDVPTKGEQIIKAVRIIEEALKPSLNLEQGGDIALNLNGLYGYCVLRLTHANQRNDDAALADVIRVIEPLAQGWKQMGEQAAASQPAAH